MARSGHHDMKAYVRHTRHEGKPALKRFKLAPKYAPKTDKRKGESRYAR